MPLFKETSSEDRVRDALIYAVLNHLYANYHYNSIRVESFVSAMEVHIRLLECEGVDLQTLHIYKSMDWASCVREAISAAVISRFMFRKTVNDGYCYFEHDFSRFAEREIQEHLPPEIQGVVGLLIEDTARHCHMSISTEECDKIVEKYKEKKNQTTASK